MSGLEDVKSFFDSFYSSSLLKMLEEFQINPASTEKPVVVSELIHLIIKFGLTRLLEKLSEGPTLKSRFVTDENFILSWTSTEEHPLLSLSQEETVELSQQLQLPMENLSKEDLKVAVDDEVLLMGFEKFLLQLSDKLTLELRGLGFGRTKKRNHGLMSQKEIIEDVMAQTFDILLQEDSGPVQDSWEDDEEFDQDTSKKTKKGKKARKVKKEPKAKYIPPSIDSITPGAYTKEDLHNLFNATDLAQYCSQNKLSTAGTKTAVIRRIMLFLETGTTEKKSGRKKSKKRA